MPNDIPEIDCLAAVRQLWDYLDEELTDDRMAIVRNHLAQCERCLPHHDFAKHFLASVRATREERLMPPRLRVRVMERLTEAVYLG
jgi:anti-sigma factor (TIGR02949 family)